MPPPGRYLLDNPAVCRGRTVLDLGSGCGASAIAAAQCGAAHVVANDIDTGEHPYVFTLLIHLMSHRSDEHRMRCQTCLPVDL